MSDTETAPEAPEAAEAEAEHNIDELPEWARKSIEKANREAAGYRTKLREVEPLAQRARELEESQKTEAQRIAEAQQQAEQRATQAEREALRYRVAVAKGIPADLVDFLSGDTEEDVAAKADVLLSRLNATPEVPRSPREVLRPGAVPPDAAEPPDFNAELRRRLGR